MPFVDRNVALIHHWKKYPQYFTLTLIKKSWDDQNESVEIVNGENIVWQRKPLGVLKKVLVCNFFSWMSEAHSAPCHMGIFRN